MAIRLDNFELAVNPVIVQRGRSYFRSGPEPRTIELE